MTSWPPASVKSPFWLSRMVQPSRSATSLKPSVRPMVAEAPVEPSMTRALISVMPLASA